MPNRNTGSVKLNWTISSKRTYYKSVASYSSYLRDFLIKIVNIDKLFSLNALVRVKISTYFYKSQLPFIMVQILKSLILKYKISLYLQHPVLFAHFDLRNNPTTIGYITFL